MIGVNEAAGSYDEENTKMKCWHCKTELIWGCDYDISHENEEFSMETILNCPNCDTLVCIYYPKEEKE